METLDAIILGIVQGFTEFLPVSSSGHLVLCEHLLGVKESGDTTFAVMVHFATVMATITVFGREIVRLLGGALKFKYNEETQYVLKIALSMVPVLIVGLFFKDQIEALFSASVGFIGAMLLVTSVLLTVSYLVSKRRGGKGPKEITYRNAFIIGIAQAFAAIPGISRSGSTIATGLLVGERKENLAKFSFLMVLVPIIGQSILEIADGAISFTSAGIPMIAGVVAAYISGLVACKAMIAIVGRGKLYYFAIYCFVVGLIAIFS